MVLAVLHTPNFHIFPDLILLGASVTAQLVFTMLLLGTSWARKAAWRRNLVWVLTFANLALFGAGYLVVFVRIAKRLSVDGAAWAQGIALIWAMIIAGLCGVTLLWRGFVRLRWPKKQTIPEETPAPRRRFLQAAGALALATPVAATTFGILNRNSLRLAETDIPIPGLHKDLEGLRIVQISDIHLSAFLSEAELSRAIDMANETRPHIALMTGDLITAPGDPLEACLRQLARLRADAGVLGCLGNHEIYTGTQDYVTQRGNDIGIDFLRMRNRELRFGGASINFAGVDYQSTREPYLVGAENLIAPGRLNILLSHNPDVFPVAAGQGYDVTIGGHTHGGQVNVEILNDNYNLARYFTRYTRGLYRHANARGYVSCGIGTVGMPVRLGAPAEVNLLRLVREV